MEKSSAQPRWWDWASVIMLFILLQTVASRLFATEWTPHLELIQSFTSMGLAVGLALGYSAFKPRLARWITFFYMLFMLPLQWTRIFEEQVSLEERLVSIAGRLLFSISEFFSNRPVEDPLFFVSIMSVTFWIIGSSAGFRLLRTQNFLAVTLPSAIGLLVIQNYDNVITGRMWLIAFFAFIALCLLGRLNFLQNQKLWRERRVFLSPENSTDISSGMAIAAGLIILTAWTIPHSFSRFDSARLTWERLTRPWTEFAQEMENAVSALESVSGGRPGEFYGTQLALGQGFPLSESVMFNVQVPNLPATERPPRYYWRGRVFDYYADDQWSMTGTINREFSPLEAGPSVSNAEGKIPRRFAFRAGESRFALIYTPAEAVWVSRPATYLASPADGNDDVLSWNVTTVLQSGEVYQVDAVLNNPNIEQLREAGVEYPEWVREKYLQLPEDFSPRISALALEVTAEAETPYDKAVAVTRYLRNALEYAPGIPEPPRDVNALEWVLFEHKEAYCVYYATAEVLMLRSVGIPARMVVGFAQGQGTTGGPAFAGDAEGFSPNTFTVRRLDAHAWPEVYFPGIGWVEFEPTGNQPALDRPAAPQTDADNSGLNPGDALLSDDQLPNFLEEEQVPPQNLTEENNALEETFALLPYLLPLFIALAALTVFLSRRYEVPARIPVFLRAAIERSGAQAPNWVTYWEHWVTLSPIEKAFESVNVGLRLLKEPAPVHATPIERAKTLTDLLPQVEIQVKTLLDEHQTSLYTSRTADVARARRAALQLRIQIIVAVLRHFFTGTYSART